MEKKALKMTEDTPIKLNTVTFMGQVISVKSRLTLEEIVSLVSLYVDELFDESSDLKSRSVMAEFSLMSTLFEVVSDYQIPSEILEDVINSGLIEEVSSKVENYNLLRDMIEKTVKSIEFRIGSPKRIMDLIDSISDIVNNFSTMEVNDEFIGKIKDVVGEIKELNVNSASKFGDGENIK